MAGSVQAEPLHSGLAPTLKYLELVISFAEIEAKLTAGRDAEYECEMSVAEAEFSSSSFLLRLSSAFSFIRFSVFFFFFSFLSHSSTKFPSKSEIL